MRFMSMLLAAAFLAASGAAMADQMSGASPKPTGAMHSSMKSSSMKNQHTKSSSSSGSSMKNENMKSNSMKSSGHMMASPKPTTRP